MSTPPALPGTRRYTGTSAAQQLHHENNRGDDEEQVNQAPAYVRHETQCPEHNQYDENGPQHVVPLHSRVMNTVG